MKGKRNGSFYFYKLTKHLWMIGIRRYFFIGLHDFCYKVSSQLIAITISECCGFKILFVFDYMQLSSSSTQTGYFVGLMDSALFDENMV